jgi:hypothetical protein
MQVTWTLDGAAAGQGDTFDVQGLAPGAHTVSAQVADATALVRGGREGLSHIHTWSVQVGANASDVVAEPAPQQHLALRVVKDATGFRVVGRRVVDGPLPREPRRGGWTFQALGPDGEVRFSRQMEDPTELRGEFQGEGGIKGRRLGQDRPAAFEVHMPLMDTRSLAVHDGTRRTLLAAD